jgi:hypothetical protein
MPLSMPTKETNKASMSKLAEKRATTRSRGRNKRSGTNGYTKISNNNMSDNELSEQIMASIGCTICSESKEFNLLTTQTDSEVIDNENLFDEKEYSAITNEKAAATGVFVNVFDSFFTLDDSLPKTISEQNSQIMSMESADLEQLTADLIKFNYSTEGTTTKYFK